MLRTLRDAFKIKDIRKKLLYTFMMLVVVRLGSQLPVPGVNRSYFSEWFAQQQSKIVDEFDEPMLVPDLKCKTKRWVSSHNCIKPEPKNYDYKLTKRDVKFYAENSESLRVFEKRYPDFFCSECKPFWNDDNGAYYLQIFLYKKTFTPDISIYSRT